MKEIVFVRHAKSSWEYDVIDRERPLKKRGINDSHLVSNYFKKYKFIPDAVFSSPAKRARKTCKIFTENLNISDLKIKIEEDIYDFSGNQLISFIKNLDKSLTKVIIFGHNYALTSIANAYGSEYIENVTTSGLVWIKFNIKDWGDFNQGKTFLTIFPRDLK